MAMWVKVKNVHPNGAVLTVLDGERREVAAGEVIQVTPEQAGAGPSWRKVTAGEVVSAHLECRELDGVSEVRELGTGLLAQTTTWEAVADKPKAATDKTAKENV